MEGHETLNANVDRLTEEVNKRLLETVERRERDWLTKPLSFPQQSPKETYNDLGKQLDRMLRAISKNVYLDDLDRYERVEEAIEDMQACTMDADFRGGQVTALMYDAPNSYPHTGFVVVFYNGEQIGPVRGWGHPA